jgi:hypothetical protein
MGPEQTWQCTILKAMMVRPSIDLKGELGINASSPAPKVKKLKAVLPHEQWDRKSNHTE